MPKYSLNPTMLKLSMLFMLTILNACQSQKDETPINWPELISRQAVPIYTYQIIAQFPHQPNAFTEGLTLDNNKLYESTGLYKASHILVTDLNTHKLIQKYTLPGQYFGEGIAILKNKLYQLTYKNQTGIVYNINDFTVLKQFQYAGEGWGLTTDGTHLIMSQGTPTLRYINPNNFQTQRTTTIHYQNKSIPNVNALAYVNNKIYANIWQQDIIIIANAQNGDLEGIIDLRTIYPMHNKLGIDAVLNGVAYNARNASFYITGKWWPYFYEVQFKPIKS